MGPIMKNWYFIAVLLSLLVTPVKQAFADNTGLVKAAAAGNKAAVLRYLKQGESIESRDQKPSGCIDHSGFAAFDIFFDLPIGCDRDDLLPDDGKGLSPGVFMVYGDDLGVLNHQIGRGPRVCFAAP